jgi:CMP/dCMP kinase
VKTHIIIAIDGPAGSGKSSVSKELAKKIGIKYIDSGAVYRAITLFFLNKFCRVMDLKLSEYLNEINILQEFNEDGTCTTFLNGKDVSLDIRSEDIAKNIGIISDDTDIRIFVNTLLRDWARNDSIIMDGRDIGTIVFPDADIKIYLDASIDSRAERRHREYQEIRKKVDIYDIKKQIALRDEQDKSRPFGRLQKSAEAKYVDTTNMIKNEVIEYLHTIITAII